MKEKILPPKLRAGDTIGIASPSSIQKPESIARIVSVMERFGYRVKPAKHLFSDTWGFIASDEERAADLNDLFRDPDVRMVMFGGGEGSIAIPRLLDYDAILRDPKPISSYSDGTTILNSITAVTGLVTYYGQTPAVFSDLRYYNYLQFRENFVTGEHGDGFNQDSPWLCLREGSGEGKILGGYSRNFAMMFGNPRFTWDENSDYILFIEDHEKFSPPETVCAYLAAVWEQPFMKHVKGFIFGCYNKEGVPPEPLANLLREVGERFGIPVAYTSDIGHGSCHGILPLSCRARLDCRADGVSLKFLEPTIGD